MNCQRYHTNEQHGAAGVMVNGIHRVMSLCVIVLLTGSIFGTQAVATDSRITDLANKAGIRILRDSSSDKQMQRTAAAQVPLNRMSRQSQQRANHLLQHTSQYRRMPTLQYEVDASLYQYLINHPDVAIATWRVMGISKLNMWQNAPFEYSAEANDGSRGQADVLWRDGNQCLFVVQGAYHSPLLPTAIEASALVWMRYRFERTRDNRILVNQQIETFINFPSPAIQTIAKLASMVTNSILDRNVMEVSLYAQMMSRAVKKDPNWVEEVAARMDGVPEHRKVELTRVARGMNPYEPQSNHQIVKQSATEMSPTQPPTTTQRPQAFGVADTDTVAPISRSAKAAIADETLSPSKQQLLHEVRTGNVVVIVKPTNQATKDQQPPIVAATKPTVGLPTTNAISMTDTIPRPTKITQPKTKTRQTATRTVSVSRDQQVIALDDQRLSASGPTNMVANHVQPNAARSVYTGHSKDGSVVGGSENGRITGPAVEKTKSGIDLKGRVSKNTKHEIQGWHPAAASSKGDQPALITLPTAELDK